ncbi:hypothetical protein [Streptomyces triticiradicis]|uniref:Uncharacterized protein n=1 Tax=Streptomyces triticiradicis TaxID=2651189 RepID=A0A7J5D506_9ACTN|nr:hypothetical protein [Streptomyces triticiradicis]KAB1979250.1 hypothetical protein F8144_36410 [Streptomyces triticiradicis]
MTDTNPPDYDGCRRACRLAAAHTLVSGECEHAPAPEPTVSLSRVYTDVDGLQSIGFDSYTVPELARLIEPALGDPLKAAAAARAIVHRNDAEQPAVSVPAPAPTDETALRDRIAETLWPLTDWDGDRCNAEAAADAVLAVLPANQTTDRAAILHEAAAALGRMDYDTDSHDYGYDTYRDAWNGGVMDAATELRRLADEAQAAAEYSRALATPPSAEALAYLRERLAGRVAGETQQPATSPAETAARIATDLRDGGRHERALGAEDVAAVLRASERLTQTESPVPAAFAPGMPCEHGCRAAADELSRETQADAQSEVRCSAALLLGHLHLPHEWQPQPGMDLVHCPGGQTDGEA